MREGLSGNAFTIITGETIIAVMTERHPAFVGSPVATPR
jgi:hypothetical protein